jgi:hypothetical protein
MFNESSSDVNEVITEKIVLTVRGKSYDIKTLSMQTVIFEDIFSNMMTGYTVITDAHSFISKITFSGLEQITLSFRTPGFRTQRIERTFLVTSVTDRILSEKEQAYVINFISVEAATDNLLRINKKFSGATDRIVRKVFDEYLKDKKKLVVAESHVTSVSVLPTFWSPLKLINWICNRSYKQSPNVLFFEGNKNFYLASIEGLIRDGNPVFDTYTFLPTAQTDLNISTKYRSISRMSAIPHTDVFRGQDYGYYASRLITHDITLKQYEEYTHDHYEYHKKVHTLHSGDTHTFRKDLPKNPDIYRRVRTKQYNMFEENKDPKYENWAMQRNSLLYEASNLRFSIEVPGRTDIEVGKVIDVLIPKSIGKALEGNATTADYLDPYLSGKYLITSIRHEFTAGQHEMTMEIMKDSFKQPIQ